jgi:antirestriction protein ArdC
MSTKSNEVMEAVASRIIASIEAGIVNGEWKKSWAGGAIAMNAVTGNQYRGGNLIALWVFGEDFKSGYWATYRQWQSIGAQVRKGETGIRLIKWSPVPCKDHGPDERCQSCGKMVPNVFTVFNAAQVDGWDGNPENIRNEDERLADAEDFIKATGAAIEHSDEGRAYYRPSTDSITLPRFESFTDAEAYYATAAHELIHWTGAESRLNRDMEGKWGDDSYAGEELVAELGSAMLCATLGISENPRPDHAQYLKFWVGRLRDDYRLLWNAASAASKAVQYVEALVAERQAEAIPA